MDGKSLNINQDKLNKLKELIPEVFTEADKIDVEKLRLTLGEEIEISNERYVLNWAGKSEAFKVLQTPTTATLAPDKDESVNFDTTENIFIEGENLEVLKVLQKSYYGKIKMIYIDPPYNTGNDSFIYPDKFSETKEEYLRRIGEKDEEGYLLKEGLFRKNSKENGQYHSNWLNMMFPRLFLAKNLLKDDGVIFVSIGDNEVHNLRLMMNEIFGEENFIVTFPWRKRTAKSDVPYGISQDYEWVIAFNKSTFTAGQQFERKYYQTEDYPEDRWRLSDLTTQKIEEDRPNSAFDLVDPKTGKVYAYNPNRLWGITKDTFKEYYDKGKIVFPDDYDFINISIPAYRVFESEDKAKALKKYGSDEAFKAVSTHLPKEVGMTESGNKEAVALFGSKIFTYPKPTPFIKYFIDMVNDPDAIILDFFAGSCTTAQAVFELNKKKGNRKFILVQIPELTEKKSIAYKTGYKTISELGKERIRRVINKIVVEKTNKHELFEGKKLDLGFKVFKLKHSNFKLWRGDFIENGEDLVEQIKVFENPVREGTEEENILYELILKSGYELTSKIEKQDELYLIADNDLIIALNKIDDSIIDKIIQLKPKKCIVLDELFKGNDQLKTNTVLQMKDAGIEFKTV